MKAGPRRGDAAPMAIIELVEPMPEPTAAGPAPARSRRAAKEESVAVLAGETEDEGTPAAAKDEPQAEESDKTA